MTRLCVVIGICLMVGWGLIGSAFAAGGRAGTTFPEQPGTHLAQECAVHLTIPAQGLLVHANANADAIVRGIYVDACLGG